MELPKNFTPKKEVTHDDHHHRRTTRPTPGRRRLGLQPSRPLNGRSLRYLVEHDTALPNGQRGVVVPDHDAWKQAGRYSLPECSRSPEMPVATFRRTRPPRRWLPRSHFSQYRRPEHGGLPQSRHTKRPSRLVRCVRIDRWGHLADSLARRASRRVPAERRLRMDDVGVGSIRPRRHRSSVLSRSASTALATPTVRSRCDGRPGSSDSDGAST